MRLGRKDWAEHLSAGRKTANSRATRWCRCMYVHVTYVLIAVRLMLYGRVFKTSLQTRAEPEPPKCFSCLFKLKEERCALMADVARPKGQSQSP